jgi:hypothetical protein
MRELEAVPVITKPRFGLGAARKVARPFEAPGANMRTQYDIAPSGEFVGLFPPGEGTLVPALNQIEVVLNWAEQLKARR